MLDLNKIEKNIDNLLKSETAESLSLWLEQYKIESLKGYIGDGKYGSIDIITSVATGNSPIRKFQYSETDNSMCCNDYKNAA